MNNAQAQLVQLLKKKGTGPTMSKSLMGDDFPLLDALFLNSNVNLTTKATMLTAILTLPPTDVEQAWLGPFLENANTSMPIELHSLIPGNTPALPNPKDNWLASIIQQVIQHQDLDKATFKKAFTQCLAPSTPGFLVGAFLEAERLKRETLDENNGCYEVMYQQSQHLETDLPLLIDIANAYDGFNRNPCLALAIAEGLAKQGLPTLLHGVDAVAPKKGQNVHQLLSSQGQNPLADPTSVITQLKTQGWSYIDQRHFSPSVHALKQLRTDMVKRPILATMEKLMQPIKAKKNILITSYTHPPYRQKMIDILQTQNTYDEILLIRGVEGATQLPMDRRAPLIHIKNGQINDTFVRPSDFGFKEQAIPLPESISPEWVLSETNGCLSDWIAYNVQALLQHLEHN